MLGLLSIFAGLVSARVGAPLLLVFLVVGMLAGEDGAAQAVGASGIVVASLLVQGWTIRQAAMLLGFGRKKE